MSADNYSISAKSGCYNNYIHDYVACERYWWHDYNVSENCFWKAWQLIQNNEVCFAR